MSSAVMSDWCGKLIICLGLVLWAAAALAEPGDADKGAEIYAKRCVLCHGEDGDGLGPATERLNPPPRDFTLGQYKIKTTGFDDIVPNDDDLFRMINDGMPGTAMPGWGDMLSEQDIRDLIAHLKIFAGLEEEVPSEQVDYGTQVASSPESIAKGKQLFHEGDRCSECHGENGKGDAVKGLKDDSGFRTWPRNLTKPWTFRASNDQKDIYTRISTGIAGTQMPSFADPVSKKKLEPEERWHVANYVNSLAKVEEVVRPENTVVKAGKLEGDLPEAPDDERWKSAEPTSFFLVPQIIAAERHFTPSNDTITVRALYNDEEVAFLLEWDDRTKSTPGDEKAEKIADENIAEDAIAIQLPVKLPEGAEKPYFAMGDAAHPVNVWQWKSGTTEAPASITLVNSRGVEDIENREAADIGIRAQGGYESGTWRVVVRRALTTADPEQDIQFVEGAFIPIAFAAWDGSNSESGTRHTLTTWYWLLLKPAAGNTPLLAALAAFVLVLLAELWWARSASRKPRTV
ncbi:MAG: c-type cytochrome [Gammaproteobacteria bacterium]|jgi:DMSO reductase family type II enzyme heme b subunit|nr:c-type cytochrome [Gammaproteobacteria bacterium]